VTDPSACPFCRIVAGTLPSDPVASGEEWVAFRDLHPQAPVHVLVVPRRHLVSVVALEDEPALAAALLAAVVRVARREGLEERGYRVVTNVGTEGGQTVPHLHFHVLGGRPCRWPPG
jgi:histidine triad (HIT) family protein